MKTSAQPYSSVNFRIMSSAQTIPLCVLFLSLLLTASASSQHNDWVVEVKGGKEVENATLQGLDGDSLRIGSLEYNGTVHVDSVVRLRRSENHVVPSLIVGVVIGGGIGYYIGNQSDDRNLQSGYYSSSTDMSGASKGTLIGVCAGGALGGFAGAFSGKVSYRLAEKSPAERRSTVRAILVSEGRTVSPESPAPGKQQSDIVYLKNGNVIRGTMLELIPDSTVRILTADSSVFVFRLSEVERMTTEPAAK